MAETPEPTGMNGVSPGELHDPDGRLFALDQALRRSRPALAPEALERIHGAMSREIAVRNMPRRQVHWPVRAAIAALVVIGLCICWQTIDIKPNSVNTAAHEPPVPGAGIPPAELARRRTELLAQFNTTTAREQAKRAAAAAEFLRITPDAEIPSVAGADSRDLCYLGALGLLCPHFQWHATFTPHTMQDVQEKLKQYADDEWPWTEAHPGEPWMIEALPKAEREKLAHGRDGLLQATDAGEFWTLDDTSAPEVTRAVALLKQNPAPQARAWVTALERNNTVLTMDVTGDYTAGQTAKIVMDARAAERVSFKLYRVQQPADLLNVMKRIGWDFIFADHDLNEMKALMEDAYDIERWADTHEPAVWQPPKFSDADLAGAWTCDLEKLSSAGQSQHERWNRRRIWDDDDRREDPDSDYFGDDCREYSQRLDRQYGREYNSPTAWQCGKIVDIPASALQKPGAYILVAEANGQKAYAPIIADALELALRRCRDGVLAVASDHDGKSPVAGAQIFADGMLEKTATDESGVAFAKVFAGGDKSIVAFKDGRFAIGGFGRLFDGIYGIEREDIEWRHQLRNRMQRSYVRADETVAHVYEDRSVVAAYTDRPVYRPGQEVNFKLIVRMLGETALGDKPPVAQAGFRDQDFEVASQLALPAENSAVKYEVLDPKNRAVAQGSLSVNDFGTCAGSFQLSDEAPTGAFSLRVLSVGSPHVVPNVFAVKCYRRPNFEVAISGVPETLVPGAKLNVTIAANYYFGKPLSAGKGHIRLVQPDVWQPIAEADFALSDAPAVVALEIPAQLAAGPFHVICAVTDDSGQTVSISAATKSNTPPGTPASVLALSDLPRFVRMGDELRVHVGASSSGVLAERSTDVAQHSSNFFAKDGVAALSFSTPGWWNVNSGNVSVPIFVYGGNEPPDRQFNGLQDLKQEAEVPKQSESQSGWVNLAYYRGEKLKYDDHIKRNSDQRADDADDDDREPLYRIPDLWALFDKQHVEVGGTLKLLVYAPGHAQRILFTFEGRTVVDYKIAALGGNDGDGPYHVVELPIRERELPNFYLQGCILSDGGQILESEATVAKALMKHGMDELQKEDLRPGDNPLWCRVDVIDTRSTQIGERLNVAVNSERKDYRPGDTVGVDIHVTGADGQPRAAEVSLSAVDESVYAFGEDRVGALAGSFSSAHPDRLFLPKAWRVGSAHNKHLYSQLAKAQDVQMQAMEQLNAVQDAAKALANIENSTRAHDVRPAPLRDFGQMPSGEIALIPWRNDFRETAAWLPQLRTNTDGTVHTQFKLPDSLTRYRLSAVGLSKATEIGTAKNTLTASLPLSVQVMLPRFAIEGDRLQATGLIHNNSAQPITMPYRWEIDGATAEDGKLNGTITVAAHGTVSVTLPLAFSAHGQASIGLRAGNPTPNPSPLTGMGTGERVSDAEQRVLTVYPCGRPLEIAMNGAAGDISLPAGFVPTDFRLSLTRSNPWECLDGLGYLVDYPHGCVEQTMSRFLPAVVVKHAMQDGAAALPDDVLKRLPAVLETGLTRLYDFQHDDGGWGWWKEDKTNNAMTVYVLYGLARCKATGTSVDANVLEKACAYVKRELSAGRLDAIPGGGLWHEHLESDLAARAYQALALAGAADEHALTALTPDAVRKNQPLSYLGYLALSCRSVGLNDKAAVWWELVKDWQPEKTDELALKLNLNVAFGANADGRTIAAKLAELRQGQRWGSTWDTSRAIEALAGFVQKLPAPKAARKIEVFADGQPLLAAKTPEELKQRSYNIHSATPALNFRAGAAIQMRTDCDEPVLYALNATGIQQLDQAAPVGTDLKMQRKFFNAKGELLTGAVAPIIVGQSVEVRVTLTLKQPQAYVLVEDRRPAGFEFAADFLEGRDAKRAAHVEFRDDRVCVYFGDLSAGEHQFSYYLRAETPGTSHVLPGCAYPMYNEKVRGETSADVLKVK